MTDRQKQQAKDDAKIIRRLTNRKTPLTAADLGTTSAHLRQLDGVVEAGRVSTGKAGRPAILWTTPDKLSEASDGRLNYSDDESQAIRAGELSAQPGDLE
jgi:hypothetical protein